MEDTELRDKLIDKLLDSGLDLGDVIEDLVNIIPIEGVKERLKGFKGD